MARKLKTLAFSFLIGTLLLASSLSPPLNPLYSPTGLDEGSRPLPMPGEGGTQQKAISQGSIQGLYSGDKLPADYSRDKDFTEHMADLGKGRLNILLLGIDARGKEASRSDSIIVVSLNPNDFSAVIFSVMRDTYVTIPMRNPIKNRINAAYMLGGPALTVKAVSNFLQLPISYYIVTDFKGFEHAIDAIGGIEVDVEKRMNYIDDGENDIHLQPGLQILNGHQALGYARFRHDVLGDYARVERQRKVLKAILAKVQGVQAVYYLPKIIEAIKPYIQTNLDLSGLATLAYYGYKLKNVKSYTIPSTMAHQVQTVNGMSVLIPNLTKTREEVHEIMQQEAK